VTGGAGRVVGLATGLAGVVGALAGCEAGTSDRDPFESPPSACGITVDTVEQLRLALGADWVGIRRSNKPLEAGARCALATDVTACQAKIDAAPAKVATPGFGSGYVIVFSRGDEVRVHGPDGNVLLPIDAPVKAFFLLDNDKWSITCDHWVRAAEGGFQVVARTITRNCAPVITEEQRLMVHTDGTLSELESHVASREESTCVGQ
jgi:hypothetical protein